MLNELRALGSEAAATYLMTQYGVECRHYFHRPLHLMLHCSWKRSDQVRLAHHFLLTKPFNEHVKHLGDFASFMSLRLLVKLIREHMKIGVLDLWTFRNYVELVLTSKAKSERDKALVSQLMAEYHRLRAAASDGTLPANARAVGRER